MRELLHPLNIRMLACHEFIQGVYDSIPKSSKLRQLLVVSFQFVSVVDSHPPAKSTLSEDMDGLREFSMDVVKEIAANAPEGCSDPTKTSRRFLLMPTSEDV